MIWCDVSRCNLAGSITCPPSKSYTHRAIFLAALAHTSGSTVTNILRSADTNATINACTSFGAKITASPAGNALTVTKTITQGLPRHAAPDPEASKSSGNEDKGEDNNHSNNGISIDAANSGTTIRIAAGIAALFDRHTTLTGDRSLVTRPMQPLLDALNSMGASCRSAKDDGRPPLEIRGPIQGGKISIPGNISSQFITSLFLCAPHTESGVEVTITDKMVSKPYLDATIGAMRKFGVSVQTQVPYRMYRIAPQMVRSTDDFVIPSDASSLALLLAASALNHGSIIINAQMGTLPQGDEAFIDMLEMMGASIEISDAACKNRSDIVQDGIDAATARTGETVRVTIKDTYLMGGKFDLENHPDLVPPLAIMALKCRGPIEIFNVGHARLKETDRIAILARELPKLGIDVKEEMEDGLVIDGSGSPAQQMPDADVQIAPPNLQNGPVSSETTPDTSSSSSSNSHLQTPHHTDNTAINTENDHRLFMALCIAATRIGGFKISDPDSVNVSYPGFTKELERLGAVIRIT